MAVDLADDIICRDRESIIIQYSCQSPWIYLEFIDQDTAHLPITVLLNDKNSFMIKDKVSDGLWKRTSLQPHAINMYSLVT